MLRRNPGSNEKKSEKPALGTFLQFGDIGLGVYEQDYHFRFRLKQMSLSRLFVRLLNFPLFWKWCCAIAVVCAIAALFQVSLAPYRAEKRVLIHQIQSAEQALVASESVPASAVSANDLFSRLPTRTRISTVASDLQALATKSSLTLIEAIYTPQEADPTKNIGRTDIRAVLKGSYPGMKKLIAELLATHEGLAVDIISIKRARAADAVLDIEVKFTFFHRTAA